MLQITIVWVEVIRDRRVRSDKKLSLGHNIEGRAWNGSLAVRLQSQDDQMLEDQALRITE